MEELRRFLERAKEDPRVGPVHISLFVVLLGMSEGKGIFRVRREEVMERAKIYGRTTYYKCMRELGRFGYIEYWRGGRRSGVRVLKEDTKG